MHQMWEGGGGDHRTLAARSPITKEIIREKIKERRDESRSKTLMGEMPLKVVQSEIKLPENYLAVIIRVRGKSKGNLEKD